MDVATTTMTLTAAGVVVPIIALVVLWFYLRNVNKGIGSLASDTKVFSDSAKSLSLDIKSLTLSLGALGQDIRSLNTSTSNMDTDVKGFNQDMAILSQCVDNLSGSVTGLIESQNRMTTAVDKLDKKHDDNARTIERVSKHFAE